MLKNTLRDTSIGFDPSRNSQLRTRVSVLLFYGCSAVLLLLLSWSLFLRDRFFWAIIEWYQYNFIYRLWTWGGIRYRIEGTIPDGDIIFASKHQSLWETKAFNFILNRPAFVFKAELLRIPIWNRYLLRMGMCAIDRTKGVESLRKLYRSVGAVFDQKRPLVIFPEGTRTLPGESPKLKSGVYGIYRHFGRPVIPVAHNSGHVWARRKTQRPGVVVVRFLPPIKPGLNKLEFEKCLWAAINTPV